MKWVVLKGYFGDYRLARYRKKARYNCYTVIAIGTKRQLRKKGWIR
jgi:hypothetical protein